MHTVTIDDVGGWPAVLGRLCDKRDISGHHARAALTAILAGEATPAQIAAFMVALRVKGETVEEMAGLVEAMREFSSPLEIPPGAIDIVGAGGSPSRRAHALNVSTMAAFVAASAGAVVCKHGNRKASSTSGSFDLLEALGVNIDLSPEAVAQCVRELGIGFAFARTFHAAMRHAGPVRAELGVPSVFNVLGPLSHPAWVTRQVIGVADSALGERMIRVLQATGSVRSMVVTGDAGLDELSTTGPSVIHDLRYGQITTRMFEPAEVGLALANSVDLVGGDAAANAVIIRRLFDGELGPVRDIVVLNAAAGLVVADVAEDLEEGVAAASAALDRGGPGELLDRLIAFSTT